MAAGFGLKASHNWDECERAIDGWTKASFEVAGPRALNKVIGQAQVAGLRVVSRVYGIGPRTMEKYIDLKPANASKLAATIHAIGASFPLQLFNPRQTREGVVARIKGRSVLFPGAFKATLRSGHVGVFARGAYGGKGKRFVPSGKRFGRFLFGKTRLPINELYTFSAPTAFSNEDVTQAMQDRADEQLPKVLEQEIRFATQGK